MSRVLKVGFYAVLSVFFMDMPTNVQAQITAEDDTLRSFEYYIQEALVAIDSGSTNLALNYLDSARLINSAKEEIYLLRAKAYYQDSSYRKALTEYDRAILYNDKNADTYFTRSMLRSQLGDHRQFSINDLDKAISLTPDKPHYYVEKAKLMVSKKYPNPSYAIAIEYLNSAIRLEPNQASFYNQRGDYKTKNNQSLAALPDFTKAIELDPENAEYVYNRGLVYLIFENYSKAIIDFNRAVQINPLVEKYLMKRGQTRFNMGQYETAILDFSLCIDTAYRNASKIPGRIELDHPLNQILRNAYVYRGNALIQVESRYEACVDFKAAKELGAQNAARYVSTYCR